MAIHLVGSVVQLAFAIIAGILFVGMWVVMPNKNNRKDLLAATAGVCLTLAAQSGYYLTGSDNRIVRLDAVTVQWEFPLFTLVQAVLLVIALGIFLAVDYHIYLILIFKVALVLGAFEMGYLSGDPDNETKTHAFWFLVSGVTLICALILGIWATKRNKDMYSWGALVYIIIFSVFIAVGWMNGPEFLNNFSAEAEYWMFFVANMGLFVLLPCLLNLLQGDEDSILNKIKGNINDRMKNKYCGKETQSA